MESAICNGIGSWDPGAPATATTQTRLGGAGRRLLASLLPLQNHGVRMRSRLVVSVIVRCTSCGNVFASSSPTVPLLVIARLVTLLRRLVTCWRPMLRPDSRNGRNVFLQEVELPNGVKSSMDKRRPETLPASGSEIYDPEGSSSLDGKRVGKEGERGHQENSHYQWQRYHRPWRQAPSSAVAYQLSCAAFIGSRGLVYLW